MHIGGLTAALETLILSDTQVTDAGLENLKGQTFLIELDLSGTNTTDQGIKKLQEALTCCRVRH